MSYASYMSYRVVQDCQCDETADFTDLLQIKGVLAHAGQGGADAPQRTENGERRTENRELRTEN